MCRSVASVVAHLTRVRPQAEGASRQDRPGPGRIPAIGRTAPALCTRAGWQRRTPDADDEHPAHAGAGLSLREGGRCRPRSIRSPSPRSNCCCRATRRRGSPAQPVDLEPPAKAVADANAIAPYVLELGPDQGRRTVDAVQSHPVNKPPDDIQDTTVPGGPSGRVSVRILRPQRVSRPLPVIVYLYGAGWVFGNNHHTHCARPSRTRTLLASADSQERLPAPHDAALGALAVEHVVTPFASASPSAVPGRPGGLVGVGEQHAAPGALNPPAGAVRRLQPPRRFGRRRDRQPPAACPRAAPGWTRPVGLLTGDPERHRPARLDCDRGWLPLVGGGASISSLRLAWPRAAPPSSGRPVVRREAVASPDGVSCLEGRG